MEMLDSKGIRIVVDATRDLLMKVLPYHPFLIKPNNHELGEIFGVELKDKRVGCSVCKTAAEKGRTERSGFHGRRRSRSRCRIR